MINTHISKYGSVQNAMNKWRDYMVSMGFGYRLGVDLPGEKRGLIPNAAFYDKMARAVNPYGDGLAARRIAELVATGTMQS